MQFEVVGETAGDIGGGFGGHRAAIIHLIPAFERIAKPRRVFERDGGAIVGEHCGVAGVGTAVQVVGNVVFVLEPLAVQRGGFARRERREGEGQRRGEVGVEVPAVEPGPHHLRREVGQLRVLRYRHLVCTVVGRCILFV